MNTIPSFYKHSRVEDWYSVINSPKIKNEILYTDYDSTHHIRIMKKFQTPEDIPCDDPEERELLNDPDQKIFFLRCYLPKIKMSRKESKNRINHVIIMFNGLNECERYDFYDVLGAQFAGQGFATILLPTPYHLNRRIKRVECTEARSMAEPNRKPYEMPTDIAFKNEALYFYSFKRSIKELENLVDRIKNPDPKDHGFFKHYFARNVKVTLFGFSLGGLRALGCFVKDPEKYHSCVTFNSGVALGRINTKGLKLNSDAWSNTFKNIEDLLENADFLHNQKDNEILELFRWLYLGREKTRLIKKLKRNSDNYLSIQSGADALFKGMPVDPNLAAPDHGLTRFIIGGVGHIPTIDLRWDNWLSKVGENIVHFINGCEEVHWAHAELEKRIKKLIVGTPFFKDLETKDKAYFDEFDFSCEVFENLQQEIKKIGGNPEKFVELYYISKAFYPKFPELLSKIIKPKRKPAKKPN